MPKQPDFPILVNTSGPRRRLTRREILQRSLAGLASVLAAPIAKAHPVYRHLADPTHLQAADEKIAAQDWKPEFLNSTQSEALIAIAERILPGSTKAQVNRVIDVLLTVETDENRQKFTASLAALDAESMKRFHRAVSRLEVAQLDDLLSACSAEPPAHSAENGDSAAPAKLNQKNSAHPPTLRDHFDNLKGWIVATYYSSEQGMRELGWTDEFYFESPAECSHPETHR